MTIQRYTKIEENNEMNKNRRRQYKNIIIEKISKKKIYISYNVESTRIIDCFNY